MTKEKVNPVVKRVAIKVTCTFASPALIGSGFGENTDSDILRRAANKIGENGKPFLPGTTVAGTLLSLCPYAKMLFGVDDKISPLWVFDSDIFGDIIELDGVALDRDNKIALDQKKYDYEAVATGAKFTIRLLLTFRKEDDKTNFNGLLKRIIGTLKSGTVTFGAKTKRGFGRVDCETVVAQEFDLSPGNTDELKRWIHFDWFATGGWGDAESESCAPDVRTLTARLKLDGSVMIRDTRNIYEGLKPGTKEPDYKHISVSGNPVILGTSWAGAVRSGLYRLLVSRFEDKAGKYIDSVFGYVNEDDKQAVASSVTFGMSTLEPVDKMVDGYRSIVRVKIDRFTGGAASGALFTEKPWYGGETTLEIRYPKDQDDIQELLILALEGIDNGFIQIGGESSVGRGFFEVVSINGKPLSDYTTKPKNNLLAAMKKAGDAE